MSVAEFGEWQEMFRTEELHPVDERMRFSQLVASSHNGPIRRRDNRAFVAADFMALDPWAEPPRPATRAEISAQIRAMNAARRRMH